MKNLRLTGLFIFVFSINFPSISNAIIGEKLLNQAGLETAWQNAIALEQKEEVQYMSVLDNYIFILTNTNYIFCLERDTGRLNFAFSAALLGMPVLEPMVYSNTAYLIAANYLIAVDLKQGMEIYREKIPFSASASASVNASHLYIPGSDKRLHITNLKDIRDIFKVSADDASVITSVTATDSSVFFTTDGGSVICMDAVRPKRIWQFDTVASITASLTVTNTYVYAGCRDTNLYKLQIDNGNQVWKFHAGSVLTTAARVTNSIIYQYAKNKGLYAIDAENGKQLWLSPDAVDLLAQDGDTAYIFDKNNICIVMDNKSAKKINTINFAPVTSFAANTRDSNIYIMEGKNISCIKPVKK